MMAAETRTIEPRPRARRPSGPPAETAQARPARGRVAAPAVAAPAGKRRKPRRLWPLLVIFAIATGLGFAAVLGLR